MDNFNHNKLAQQWPTMVDMIISGQPWSILLNLVNHHQPLSTMADALQPLSNMLIHSQQGSMLINLTQSYVEHKQP